MQSKRKVSEMKKCKKKCKLTKTFATFWAGVSFFAAQQMQHLLFQSRWGGELKKVRVLVDLSALTGSDRDISNLDLYSQNNSVSAQ